MGRLFQLACLCSIAVASSGATLGVGNDDASGVLPGGSGDFSSPPRAQAEEGKKDEEEMFGPEVLGDNSTNVTSSSGTAATTTVTTTQAVGSTTTLTTALVPTSSPGGSTSKANSSNFSCSEIDNLFGHSGKTDDGCSGGMAFVFAALPALLVAFTARRYFKATLFLAGFGSLTYFFYVLSPKMFPNTAFCCGENGTELGHIVVSCGVGFVGGLITLFVMKLGLFAIGACLGVLLGLIAMATPLREQAFFEHNYAFIVFYGCCALLFGLLATLMEKLFIVMTTAIAGTLVFSLGIDYFAKTGFGELMFGLFVQIEHAVKSSIKGQDVPQIEFDPANKAVWVIIGVWGVLALVAIVVQYRYPKETSKAEKELEEEEKVLKGRAKLRRKYSSKDSRRNPMWRRSRADSGEIEMESLVGSVEC